MNENVKGGKEGRKINQENLNWEKKIFIFRRMEN